MSIGPSYAAGGPRWLPRAERFVRHALLAEPAFLDLHREGFFLSLAGKLCRDGQFNISLPDRDACCAEGAAEGKRYKDRHGENNLSN